MNGFFRALRPWLLAGLVALPSAASLAAQTWAQLAYEPVALAWTAQEVERETAGNFDRFIERAKKNGQFGCRQHCDRVRGIFDRLVTLSRMQSQRAQRLPWSLTVVRTDEVEAMALPGGQLLVSEAFIDSRRLQDEEIAFVLAHEMAHSILEHERQTLHMARMLLPRNVQRSVADMYAEIDLNYTLLKSIEPVIQQGELEADELGLLLASAAGFAPQRQLGFIEREAGREQAAAGLLCTHPPARQRRDQLRSRLGLAERVHAAALAGSP